MDIVIPPNPSYETLDGKRKLQLAELSRIISSVNQMSIEKVTLRTAESFMERLKKNESNHNVIIEAMYSCPAAVEANVTKHVEKFYSDFTAIEQRIDIILEAKLPSRYQRLSEQLSEIEFFLKAYENLRNDDCDDEQENNLRTIIIGIEPLKAKFNEIFCEIRREQMSGQEAAESESRYFEFLKLYGNTLGFFQDKLKQLYPGPTVDVQQGTNAEKVNEQSQSPFATAKIKLPPIELPKFDGAPESWTSYRDTFKSIVHSNGALTGAVKFHYLKTSIIDKMSPISHLKETDDGYTDAWQAVLDFYDDERKIVEKHLSSLLTAKRMTSENHEELQKLLNTFNNHTAGLEHLIPKENLYETLIAHLINHRLDPATRNLFETENSEKIPQWSNLKKFLEKRRKTLSTISTSKGSYRPMDPQRYQPQYANQKQPFRYATAHTTQAEYTTDDAPLAHTDHINVNAIQAEENSSLKGKCLMCNNRNHKLAQCALYIALNATQRFLKIKELGLCTNCLGFHSFVHCKNLNTCRTCQKKHHTSLHKESPETSKQAMISHLQALQITDENHEEISPNQSVIPLNPNVESFRTVNSTMTGTKFSNDPIIFLSTAIVRIKDKDGQWHEARALLDSGADANFITTRIANVLNLPKIPTMVQTNGFGGATNFINNKVNAQIRSRLGWYNKEMEFFVTPKITGMTPSSPLTSSKLGIPLMLELADPTFDKPGKIDLLIGNEFFLKLILNERIELPAGPILQETVFGFILAGKISSERKISTVNCNLINHSDLRVSIEKFYKDEDYRNTKRFLSEEETFCEAFFERTHQRTSEGRFIVEIPLKENVRELSNNRGQAYSQFISNEKRLEKNMRLKDETIKFMREYESLGHMTEISSSVDENSQSYYLPHHAVENPDSTTTKVRIVFNASSKTKSGLSFNDVQYNGPVVQKDSFSLNLRFRLHNVVIKADIAKMYRQILVKPEQRKFQRILWREAPHLRMKTYELNTVTYGTKSASFNSTRCLKQLAIENREVYPQAAKEIENAFYIDDLISGSNTTQNAIQLFSEIDKIINSSQMKLRKISSNCSKFMMSIPFEDREMITAPDKSVKVLGIRWNPESDQLEFDVKPIQFSKVTKRIVLSEIAKLYDPEGLLGPVVFKFKQFMKIVYDLKLSWDAPLPESEISTWISMASTFPQLNQIRINRQITLSTYIIIQLHGFCDASEQGFGAVIYARTEDSNGIIMSALICAKSRIAPSARKSIARLELSGGVILANLITKTIEALNIKFNKIFCWTDSAIVLHWLKKSPSALQTYVANRVSEIQEITKQIEIKWRHIRGEHNPADLISRGLMPQEIIDNKIWWNGPTFLEQVEKIWPSSMITLDPDDPLYCSEFKRILISANCASQNDLNPFIKMIDDSSRTFHIKWKVAHVIRFIFNVKANRLGFKKRTGRMNIKDLQDAEIMLARIHQKQYFKEEFQQLSSSKVISTKSSIKNLDPFWDPHDRIIRVGGRLNHAKHISSNQKHPIILPKSHFASLIVREIHQQNMHTGQQATLGILKMKYWPIRAKNIVRLECHKCIKCFRSRPHMIKQFMGQLPEPRITPAPVFYHTGIDYAGPITMKTGYTKTAKAMKAYIALFVCLATKAIHLEIVSELTTKAFLAALDRFSSRRGLSGHIYSDNGTNFIGAKRELKDLNEFLQATSTQAAISQHLLKQEISWHLIPPNSPEQGGLWEAGVKSMKYHLQRVTGEAYLHYEELQTLVCKIEAILNSRPITPISNDPNDLEALTNGHILIGRPLLSVPQHDVSQTPIQRLQRWDRILQLQQLFWKRWTSDYLHQLQIRTKNYKTQTPISIGQIVLIQIDNSPPLHWPIGRIIEIFPGKDGISRVAKIKTANSVYERAVNKLAILPIDDNEHFSSRQDVNCKLTMNTKQSKFETI